MRLLLEWWDVLSGDTECLGASLFVNVNSHGCSMLKFMDLLDILILLFILHSLARILL